MLGPERSRIGNSLQRTRRRVRLAATRLYRLLPLRTQNAIDGLQQRYRTGSLSHSLQNAGALSQLLDDRFAWATDRASNLPLASPHPPEWPKLDVSLVTYNSARWLPAFFASLLAQDYPLDRIHLHLVDHGSTDSSVLDIEAFRAAESERFASVEVLQRPNLGFGAGHDTAIKRGAADFVLVTNADLSIEHDAITTLIAVAVADDGRTASWEARQKPYEHPKHYDPVTGETNWSSHAFVLMRRSAYQKVGGYERRIFMYGEDVELSYRFRKLGYRLRYVPQAVVQHYTYEDLRRIQPHRYTGSILANLLLRLRYGTIVDAMLSPLMLLRIARLPQAYPGSRKGLATVAKDLVRKAPHFLAKRGTKTVSFPFRGMDYEIVRDGAFVAATAIPDCPPLVSIVIRTYRGRAPILRQAIASALQQTYPAIEVVVVEDGGDEMRAIVEAFASPPGRSIVYRSLPKLGRSAAGNEGLRTARGEYVNFLDDDDLLYLDHVETLIAALRTDTQAVAAYALAWQIATSFGEKYKDAREMEYEMLDVFRQPFSHDVLQHHNYIPIQACLFQRRLFLERGGFEESLDALEDWNLWLRYAHGQRFAFVPKTTSLFRIPADMEARRKRGQILHNAYETAKLKAMDRIAAHQAAARDL